MAWLDQRVTISFHPLKNSVSGRRRCKPWHSRHGQDNLGLASLRNMRVMLLSSDAPRVKVSDLSLQAAWAFPLQPFYIPLE